MCAETFQGSVGGRRACSPLIQLFFCFCSVQTNTYRGIEGGNWLSSLGGEGVYLVRAVPESRACGGRSFEAFRSQKVLLSFEFIFLVLFVRVCYHRQVFMELVWVGFLKDNYPLCDA